MDGPTGQPEPEGTDVAEFTICAYKDQAAHGAATGILPDDGTLTGHHMIPDHCFFYTSGLRGKGYLGAFWCPGVMFYDINDAPVILLSADNNGGKSRNHGLAHAVFDPIETTASQTGNEWTYAEARAAAVRSIATQFSPSEATVRDALDNYFIATLGMTDDTVIRAGEHGTMASAPEPRRSGRAPRAKLVPSQRFSPY
jgi:hypothetical protein